MQRERERERERESVHFYFFRSFTVERTTNKWPATCTRATSSRIGKRILRSECRFRKPFVNRVAGPALLHRGREGGTHFNRQSFTIRLRSVGSLRSFSHIPSLSLSPSLFSSLRAPPPWFPRVFSIYPTGCPPPLLPPCFSPRKPAARVSRLKRHLLIVTRFLRFLSLLLPLLPPSFLCFHHPPRPLVPSSRLVSRYVRIYTLFRLEIDIPMMIDGQRSPATYAYLVFLRTPCVCVCPRARDKYKTWNLPKCTSPVSKSSSLHSGTRERERERERKNGKKKNVKRLSDWSALE